jgi:alcohol dehydrogenase (cytochrome c)
MYDGMLKAHHEGRHIMKEGTSIRTFGLLPFLAGGGVVLLTLGTTTLMGQSDRLSYTAEQALQGQVVYKQSCESCHGAHLDDGEFGPPLRGEAFLGSWGGKPADAFFTHLRTMPPSNPGGLSADVYAQLFSYLLQQNGARPGAIPLPSRTAALTGMIMPTQSGLPDPAAASPAAQPGSPAAAGRGGALRLGGSSGGISPYAKLPAYPVRPSPLDKFTPVTDAMLANPPAGEWLSWRRSHDDLGFSPLKQINKTNIGNLRVAWEWALPGGPNEATPLYHDGVIFVYGDGDKVQALDAIHGEMLWQYSRELPEGVESTSKRNIALYGNRVYFGTSDVHVVALDAKTGKVVWDHELLDYKGPGGARLTGGPLVAKGKVMIGTVGRTEGGCLIVGLDAETGKEAWRFHTIAQPGEPYGESWNGLSVEKRNGGSVWTAGSYDAANNLAYFGVAQTYDTGPLRNLINKPGVTNDGLYTDSTVAIDPDTGKLAWHFQHMRNDQWDLDWAFERQLIAMPVNGQMKRLSITGGKEAVFDAVDAKTGAYAFSFDLGLQNLITSIDPKTGEKTVNKALTPGDGETKTVCPHVLGAKNWIPNSINPGSKVLFIPMVEACMDLVPVKDGGRGNLSTGVRWTLRPPLDTDGKYGRLEAVDLQTRKPVWIVRQRAPLSSGVLDTAGGVVFVGSLDREFSAYDDSSGKLLWHQQVNDVPSSAPITFEANGKQYVAMVVSNGGLQAATYRVLVPDIKNPPDRNATLWVFALPDKTP